MFDVFRMTPRPMYCWKSFWLGVFVVCFFAWAWRDSLRTDTWMQRIWASGRLGMIRVQGVTWVYRDAEAFFDLNGVQRRATQYSAKEVEEMEFEGADFPYVKIPDGAVWACFAVVWGGWMVWRWRRGLKRTPNIEHRTSNIE